MLHVRGITAPMCLRRSLLPLLLLGLLLAGCTHNGSARASSTESPSRPVHLPIPEVRRLQADLVSGDEEKVREALEMPTGRRLQPGFVHQLHELRIVFQPATAVAVGPQQVALDARVTSPDGTMTWRVTLDHVQGGYLVSDTRQVQP